MERHSKVIITFTKEKWIIVSFIFVKDSFYRTQSLMFIVSLFPTSLICLCAVLLWKNGIQVQNITRHSLFEVQYNVIIRRDICDEGKEKDYPMCPRCDQRCPYWLLSDTCIYSKVCNAVLCPCYEHYATACIIKVL